MYLRAYLEMRNLTMKQFAEELGVSKSTIVHYISGRRTPRLKFARKIERKTKGKVTIDELLEYAEKIRSSHGSTTDGASMDVRGE